MSSSPGKEQVDVAKPVTRKPCFVELQRPALPLPAGPAKEMGVLC